MCMPRTRGEVVISQTLTRTFTVLSFADSLVVSTLIGERRAVHLSGSSDHAESAPRRV